MSTPPVPPTPPHEPSDGSQDDRGREQRPQHEDPTGVRELLGSLPDPGPMPAGLAERISASIAAEQAARADSTVVPFIRRTVRWRQAALVAAAVAAIGLGAPALLDLTRNGIGSSTTAGRAATPASDSAAQESAARESAGAGGQEQSYAQPAPSDTPGERSSAKDAAKEPVTIYASDTAYTSASLAAQAKELLTLPIPPLRSLAAESPAIGPVGTPAGLGPCLTGLRGPGESVVADLATFDGTPAVIVVTRTDAGDLAYALPRTCATSTQPPLAGPVNLG